MSFTVTNITPRDIDPIDIAQPLSGNYDYVQQLDPLIAPIYVPRHAGTPVNITDGSGTQLTKDDLISHIVDELTDNSSQQMIDTLSELAQAVTINAKQNHGYGFRYAAFSQNLAKLKLPPPSYAVRYGVDTDIVPAAKTILSGHNLATDWATLGVSINATFSPQAYTCGFLDAAAFHDFKTHLRHITTLLGSHIDTHTAQQFAEFDKEPFDDITCALSLRDDRSQETDDHSFARIIVHALNTYFAQHRGAATLDAAFLPYDLRDSLCPEAVIMVNVEKHATSSVAEIHSHWQMLMDALAGNKFPVSLKNINKLTAAAAMQKRHADTAAQAQKNQQQEQKRGHVALISHKKPSINALKRDITRVLHRMGVTSKSQNVYTTVVATRNKPSRRKPTNPDAKGKRRSKNYLPDIHIYADCSGSISNEDLQHTFSTVAHIAAAKQCNIYFTSFSHRISTDTLIKTKGKSPQAIIALLNAIPKVTGGTEFDIVWDHINKDPGRKKRLNLIITDFQYIPPSNTVHPPNTYYTACESSHVSWSYFQRYAQHFCEKMKKYDPTIDMKLLGMR